MDSRGLQVRGRPSIAPANALPPSRRSDQSGVGDQEGGVARLAPTNACGFAAELMARARQARLLGAGDD